MTRRYKLGVTIVVAGALVVGVGAAASLGASGGTSDDTNEAAADALGVDPALWTLIPKEKQAIGEAIARDQASGDPSKKDVSTVIPPPSTDEDTTLLGIVDVDRTIPGVQGVYTITNAWVQKDGEGVEQVIAGGEIDNLDNGVVVVRHTGATGEAVGTLDVIAGPPGAGFFTVKDHADNELTLTSSDDGLFCFDITSEKLTPAPPGGCA